MVLRKVRIAHPVAQLSASAHYQPEPRQPLYEPEISHRFSRDDLGRMLDAYEHLNDVNKSIPWRRIQTSPEIKDLSGKIRACAISIDGRLYARK